MWQMLGEPLRESVTTECCDYGADEGVLSVVKQWPLLIVTVHKNETEDHKNG